MTKNYTEEHTIEAEHENTIPVVEQLTVALGVLVLVFGTTYVGSILSYLHEPETPQVQDKELKNQPATVLKSQQPNEDFFENISLTAASAYVWDVRKQKALFNEEADIQLPLASVTKLMTALVAYELLNTHDSIEISLDAIKIDGDSGLSDGEVFNVQNLSDLMLIASSNDGAHALAATAGETITGTQNDAETFIDAMNVKAEEIGLSQTFFSNATGLDLSETRGGAYGSARDMAFLMEYIIINYPEIVESTQSGSLYIPNSDGEAHLAANTNSVISEIEGIIGSKTGYTALAGGNLVIAFNAGLNRPIIVSVLGSTKSGRFDDVLELSSSARKHVTHNN